MCASYPNLERTTTKVIYERRRRRFLQEVDHEGETREGVAGGSLLGYSDAIDALASFFSGAGAEDVSGHSEISSSYSLIGVLVILSTDGPLMGYL